MIVFIVFLGKYRVTAAANQQMTNPNCSVTVHQGLIRPVMRASFIFGTQKHMGRCKIYVVSLFGYWILIRWQ